MGACTKETALERTDTRDEEGRGQERVCSRHVDLGLAGASMKSGMSQGIGRLGLPVRMRGMPLP